MAPRDNQELVPLTDGGDGGHADDDDPDACGRKRTASLAAAAAARAADPDAKVQTPINDMKASVLACRQIVGMGALWRFPYACLKYGGGEYWFEAGAMRAFFSARRTPDFATGTGACTR